MTPEEVTNEESFESFLEKTNPHLWKIHMALKDTKVNSILIPYVINAIHEISFIHGHGTVTIFITNNKVTNIEPKSSMKVKISALIE